MVKTNFTASNDTLVLNSDGLPLSVIPISTITWRDAFVNSYQDKVDVLHTYDNWVVHSAHAEYQVPAVVLMRDWVKIGRTVQYSRNNIYIRDRYTCQYCGDKFNKDDLTLDHYVPKSAGGKSNWNNLTSACRACNHAKGDKITGWVPRNMPRKPSYGEISVILKESPIFVRHPAWNYYLGWPEHLVRVNQ